jgi:hypothetical protein
VTRRYSATAAVKTTSSGGHVVLTEAGVAVQGNGTATSQTVT